MPDSSFDQRPDPLFGWLRKPTRAQHQVAIVVVVTIRTDHQEVLLPEAVLCLAARRFGNFQQRTLEGYWIKIQVKSSQIQITL